jgi:small subunit ribosomal protein S6
VTKRVYESTVVFDGVLPEDTLRKEIGKVKDLLGGDAAIKKVDEWGRRDLAYEIRKRKSGYYVLFVHENEGDIPGKLNRVLSLNESVLRHLSVVIDPKVAELQVQRKAEMLARVAAAVAAGEPDPTERPREGRFREDRYRDRGRDE